MSISWKPRTTSDLDLGRGRPRRLCAGAGTHVRGRRVRRHKPCRRRAADAGTARVGHPGSHLWVRDHGAAIHRAVRVRILGRGVSIILALAHQVTAYRPDCKSRIYKCCRLSRCHSSLAPYRLFGFSDLSLIRSRCGNFLNHMASRYHR